MTEERNPYELGGAYRPAYGSDALAALKMFIQQVGTDLGNIAKTLDTLAADRELKEIKSDHTFTALKQQASDIIRLEKKLDAILACFACPKCGGKGILLDYSAFSGKTSLPPLEVPCYCRDAARAVLEE